MASTNPGRILEGVFAIQKPPHLSSAQVLRDLQTHFTPSQIFAPLLEQERLKRESQSQYEQKRRKKHPNDGQVKLGHGGTLDPLATGVLIIGVGRGTKHLQDFTTGSSKTYETAILFGKATDTYDIAGKVVASASYAHITRKMVEEQLDAFRGQIKQVPPVYSALKINGMKAYEYARSGRELPRELEAREMEVHECKMTEWHEGGTHEYRWPADEASDEDKLVAARLRGDDNASNPTNQSESKPHNPNKADSSSSSSSPKRKLPESDEDQQQTPAPKKTKLADSDTAQDTAISKNAITQSSTAESSPPPTHTAAPALPHPSPSPTPPQQEENNTNNTHSHALSATHLSSTPAPAPAAVITLTVSSGFYVRSFAHDLGLACNSLALMASLSRTRQGAFSLADCLSYADLAAGEPVWGLKVERMLDAWAAVHPPATADETPPRVDDRDRYPSRSRGRGRDAARWRGDRNDAQAHRGGGGGGGYSAKRGFVGRGGHGGGHGGRGGRGAGSDRSRKTERDRNTSSEDDEG